jgi:hypothetical protein
MKKYTCAGQGAGKRVRGYASGGGVGGGGGSGGGGWSDEGVYPLKYETPPSERGAAPKTSPLGGRMFGSDRIPKLTDSDLTASKKVRP